MTNRFNFRAYIKPYNKIYKINELKNDGNFFAVKCFNDNGFILKRNDNRTDLPIFTEGEFELMQSTGLVDKNGKEIYEGDIIRYKGFFDTIRFINYNLQLGRLVASYINDITDYCDFNREWISKYEVIGNIYENKELLGEQ